MEKFPQTLWSTEFHIFHEFCGKLNSTEFVESNFLVESTFSEVGEFILSWVKKPRVACMTRVAAALSLRQRCSAFQIVSNSSRLTLDFLLKVTSSTTSRTTQAVEIDRLLFTSDEEDNESSLLFDSDDSFYAKTTESGIVERSFSSSDAYDDVDVFADDLEGHHSQRVDEEKEEDLFEWVTIFTTMIFLLLIYS